MLLDFDPTVSYTPQLIPAHCLALPSSCQQDLLTCILDGRPHERGDGDSPVPYTTIHSFLLVLFFTLTLPFERDQASETDNVPPAAKELCKSQFHSVHQSLTVRRRAIDAARVVLV